MSVNVFFLGRKAADFFQASLRTSVPTDGSVSYFTVDSWPPDSSRIGPTQISFVVSDRPPSDLSYVDGLLLLAPDSVTTSAVPTLLVDPSGPPNIFTQNVQAMATMVQASQASQSRAAIDVNELNSIGAALSEKRELDDLLPLLLDKALTLLQADAGSIYLTEGADPHHPTHLRFKIARNQSIDTEFTEFLIPISASSLAGYVAQTKKPLTLTDVYRIPPDLPFSFNREIDRQTGYRCKSVVSVAMIDNRRRVIGVMQLWNKKRDRACTLTPANVDDEVIPFSSSDQQLLASLAGQAGIAIENSQLYTSIKNLFEGFIRASVTAIEARDPTTSGHSERVSVLTCGLAREVNRVSDGPFRDIRFSKEDLVQLEYAAVLHDFGKIGVRENILIKANKLYPLELDLIRSRVDVLYQTALCEIKEKLLEHILKGGKKGDAQWKHLDAQARSEKKRCKGILDNIWSANMPSVLPEAVKKDLDELRSLRVESMDGQTNPIASSEQLLRLTIAKGSLSEEERKEIESHVSYTYQFLARIPWTFELKRTAEIAYAHHEKLDGSGYPRGITQDEIPFPSRIMAIADIFDALAARDRPYKKALPVSKALDILKMEAQANKLDPDLVELFIACRLYEKTMGF